jgi:HEAT repeat protein
MHRIGGRAGLRVFGFLVDDAACRSCVQKLSEYLQTYAPSSAVGRGSRQWNQADEAVRRLGWKSIPMLLHMLGERDSDAKVRFAALLRKAGLIQKPYLSSGEKNVAASRAFIALGAAAEKAVPALLKLHGRNVSPESQCAINDALGWIGPRADAAVPTLLRSATNRNPLVRASALWALGEIGGEAQLSVPVLTSALRDKDQWTQVSAAHALGMFGAAAQSAIPSLSALTNAASGSSDFSDLSIRVRIEAVNALSKSR